MSSVAVWPFRYGSSAPNARTARASVNLMRHCSSPPPRRPQVVSEIGKTDRNVFSRGNLIIYASTPLLLFSELIPSRCMTLVFIVGDEARAMFAHRATGAVPLQTTAPVTRALLLQHD